MVCLVQALVTSVQHESILHESATVTTQHVVTSPGQATAAGGDIWLLRWLRQLMRLNWLWYLVASTTLLDEAASVRSRQLWRPAQHHGDQAPALFLYTAVYANAIARTTAFVGQGCKTRLARNEGRTKVG